MIGSSTAARRAGHTPNATPTNAEKAKANAIAMGEITVVQPAVLLITAAPPAPRPMPSTPPRTQSTTASMRNWSRMFDFVAPSALRIPISRVRSVTERTREIGIRKALGATRGNILLQFLIEAVVLCLLGGLIGALVGSGGATAMSAFFQWNTIISPLAIAAAFVFSAVVGVLFGVWPARRAASLDPIVALRYE